MEEYTTYDTRCASLAAVGLFIRREGVWRAVEERVQIEQKTVRHTPTAKLLSVLISILAGGQRVVEINRRLGCDKGLQRAFGLGSCADQSGVSRTLQACTEKNVLQMQEALKAIFQRLSRASRHAYREGTLQLLDVDMTGLPCGPKAEKATKGYFAGHRGCCGRQLGRVLATGYGEIVYEQVYAGTVQLEKCLQELLQGAEGVLSLDQERRSRTVVRADGGGGNDGNIEWLLKRGYQLLVKVKNWQRTEQLCGTVHEWYADPGKSDRQLGWVSQPHDYPRPTRQLAIRWPQGKELHYSVIVTTLSDSELAALAGSQFRPNMTEPERLAIVMGAYDKRGGGIETSIRASKQGINLTSRNKQSFVAQQMLALIAQLAYNLIQWVHRRLARTKRFKDMGVSRLIREVMQIAGTVSVGARGQIKVISLSQADSLAQAFQCSMQTKLKSYKCALILH